MAELAARGYNVSIPEIDVGDDILVLNDSTGSLSRVQVKTATGKKREKTDGAYSCQFRIKSDHIGKKNSGTHYVLVGRCGTNWRYLIFKRDVLNKFLNDGKLGTKNTKHFVVTCVFTSRDKAAVSMKKDAFDLSKFTGKWTEWPKLP